MLVRVVEAAAEKVLVDFLNHPEDFGAAADGFLAEKIPSARLEQIDAGLQELDRAKAKWDAAYERGVQSLDEYADRIEKWRESRMALLGQREAAEYEARDRASRDELIEELRSTLDGGRLSDKLTRLELKTLYQHVFERLSWRKDGLTEVVFRT